MSRRGSGRPSKTSSILQHVSQQVRQMRTNQELPALNPFFCDKIINMRATISLKLDGVLPDQMHDDKPFCEQELYNLPLVTEGEVQKLLLLTFGKLKALDFVPTSLPSPQSSLGWQTSPLWKVLSLPASQMMPLLKKVWLGTCDPSNHMSTSNLNTISKVRGWQRHKSHCSSRFGSVGCVQHYWPVGSPAIPITHFQNQWLGP